MANKYLFVYTVRQLYNETDFILTKTEAMHAIHVTNLHL